MIAVGELKNICGSIEKEYGSDAKVILRIRGDEGSLIEADYCNYAAMDREGNLYLSNHEEPTN